MLRRCSIIRIPNLQETRGLILQVPAEEIVGGDD